MRKWCKKLYESDYFSFFILFMLELFAHLFITLTFGDDLTFSKVYKSGVIDRLIWNYHNWSTRLVIEGVYYNLYRFPDIVWKVLDSMIMVLIPYSISRIFNFKNKRKMNFLLSCLVLAYPMLHMMTAGWVSTSANYTWAVAMGFYSLIVLSKLYRNETVRWYEYIFSILALIYGSNAEQTGCVLFGFLVLLLIYSLYNRRVVKYHIFQFIIVSIMLIFKITGPSNAIVNETIASYYDFHDWYTLNLVDKLYLGFITTIQHYATNTNLIFLILLSGLCFGIIIKRNHNFYKLIGCIPLAFVASITLFKPITKELVPALGKYFYDVEIDLTNFNHIAEYIPFAILIIICMLICMSIYMYFGNSIKSIEGISLFGIGIAARMIMGFSPSIFASSTRTYCVTYFVFIMLIALVSDDLYTTYNTSCQNAKKFIKGYEIIIVVFAIMSYFGLLISL